MPRAGLTPAAVVSAALAVIDERGPGALTLAAVAEQTGVAAPSLYKHVASLGALRDLVTVRIYDELAARLTAAALGRSGDVAVFALAEAYQAYAEEHPHRYGLMPQSPPASRVAGADSAAGRVVSVFSAVLAGLPVAEDDLVHAVRGLRAALHGFAALSLSGGFGLPADPRESRRRLIATFVAGLRVIHSP